MTNDQYLKYLQENVAAVLADSASDAPETKREEAFLEVIKPLLVDANAIPEFHPSVGEIRGKSAGNNRAYRVDGYNIPEDNATVIDLIIVDWHNSDSETSSTITPAQVNEHFELLESFFERSLNTRFHTQLQSDQARNAAEYIARNNASNSIGRVRLSLISNRRVNFAKLSEVTKGDGLEFERNIWDLQRLRQLAEGSSNRAAIDIIVSDFAPGEKDPGIKGLHAQQIDYKGVKMDVYMGVIRGDILAKIYGSHGMRLMESNVRAYLQGKTGVNKGILQTAISDPSLFVTYNNGICVTASSVKAKQQNGATLITQLNNFQIVNGGQTTASLHSVSLKKSQGNPIADLTHVQIPYKLIVIDDTLHEDPQRRREAAEHVDSLVHNISNFSNKQNKITLVDLSANSPFQRSLEKVSRTTNAITGTPPHPVRWYYERARGSYNTELNNQTTTAALKEFETLYPKANVFDKKVLGRLENLWRLEPYTAAKGAETSFMVLMKFFGPNPPKPTETYFKHLVAKKILLDATTRSLKEQGVHGHRAATALYVLSWVFKKTAHRINLDAVWTNQAPSPAFMQLLTAIGYKAHEFITEYGAGKNMLSAFASRSFWDLFKDQTFNLTPANYAPLERELLPTTPELFVRERTAAEEKWDNARASFVDSERMVTELAGESGVSLGQWKPDCAIKRYAELTYAQLLAIPQSQLTARNRNKVQEIMETLTQNE